MAPVGFSGRRRQFDVACGVLSRCVKKAQSATTEGKMTAAPAPAAAARPTMLLMPGADVAPDVRVREEEPEAAQLAQLTIVYGDQVLVFDDFPSYRVAELARKASLQRFMEKRRDRLAARAPYGGGARPGPDAPAPSNKDRDRGEQDAAGSWLGLGVPGGSAC